VSKAEECRAKAVECFEWAKRVHDPDLRRRYNDIALQWLALAEQIAREEKRKR
jgi:hypothetical protein